MEPPYVIYRPADHDNDDSAAPDPTRSRRYRLTTWLRRHRPTWARTPDWAREPGNWITAGIVAVVLGVALALLAGVVWLLWTIITAIGDALDATGTAITTGVQNGGDLLSDAGRWITHGPITHSVSDPVRAYLDAHTTGLPATGRDLWILWLVAVSVLFTAAMFGSRYARVAWPVVGVLTAAAAWHGTTTAASRPAAAATTIVAWLLLSLLAYTRRIDISALERRFDRDRHRTTPADTTTTDPAGPGDAVAQLA